MSDPLKWEAYIARTIRERNKENAKKIVFILKVKHGFTTDEVWPYINGIEEISWYDWNNLIKE
jgi:hypothetical protein